MNPAEHPMDASLLLQHRDFLRTLAHSLVGDEHRAEDVVQDTWVTALERPPRSSATLSSWLRRVARNFALKTAQRENQRVDREARAARDVEDRELGGRDADIQFELQHQVATALLSLPEPYKTAIYLRYYKDLGPSAIAEQQGVAVQTVKTRLRRGLDRLRARLDERNDGQRAVWLAPMSAFLRSEPVAPAAGAALSTGAVVKGVLAMKLTSHAATVFAVCGIAFLGYRAFWATPELSIAPDMTDAFEPVSFRPIETEAVQEEAFEVEDSGERVAVAGGEIETQAAAPATRVGSIRVVDEYDHPLPGALAGFAEAGEATYVETGPLGSARIPLPAFEEEAVDRRLVVRAEGYVSQERSVSILRGEAAEFGTLALARAGSIVGRIVDSFGEGLADAEVFAAEPGQALFENVAQRVRNPSVPLFADGESEVDGSFRLRNVQPGQVRVWAGAPEMMYGCSGVVAVRPGEETYGLIVRLDPSPSTDEIRGIVRLPDGEVQHGGRLWYRFDTFMNGTRIFTAQIGEDGRFRIPVERQVPHDIWFADFGDHRSEVIEGVLPGTNDVEVWLQESPRVLLEVVDHMGVEMEEFTYDVSLVDGPQPRMIISDGAVTGEPGTTIVVPGTHFLVYFSAEGHEEVRLGPFSPTSYPSPIRAELSPLPLVRGRVTAGGKPIVGARVEFYTARDKGETVEIDGFQARMNHREAEGTTGDDGAFATTVRHNDDYFVIASAPGWTLAEYGPIAIDPSVGLEGIEVDLVRGGTIEGRVKMPVGISPGGVLVGISRGDPYARTQRTSPDGSFRFESLTPGDWLVERTRREVVPGQRETSTSSTHMIMNLFERKWRGNCEVLDEQVARIDLDYSEGTACTLVGRLTFGADPPTAWRAELYESVMGPMPTGDILDQVPVSAEGVFELVVHEPGDYGLILRNGPVEGGGVQIVQTMDLRVGRNEEDYEFAVGRVEGVIESFSEQLVYVYAWSAGEKSVYTRVMPDAEGHFTLEAVPVGEGRIVYTPVPPVSLPEAWPSLGRVSVPAEGVGHFVTE